MARAQRLGNLTSSHRRGAAVTKRGGLEGQGGALHALGLTERGAYKGSAPVRMGVPRGIGS